MNSNSHSTAATNALRQLPSVHELLDHAALACKIDELGHHVVRDAARACLDYWRDRLLSDAEKNPPPALDEIITEIMTMLASRQQVKIRHVINATGILLHTGLGRAPLAESAIEAVLQSVGYCNVELDLDTGERTKRHEIVQEDLCALTGAEAALVVNNNAGATGLVLAAFACGREAIVSHGQLVEIGGGFRLPDVFRAYGARLRAVGTTNRTRVADYEAAINEQTGAIMVIHASNYQVVGFTEQPSLRELVDLTRDRDFPLVHDIGSGALVDFLATHENDEPLVRQSIAEGAGLVLFSGDKLLGGPQAGIIVGKRHLVEQLAQHPMSRALRVDKMTLAALQATLAIYRRGESDATAYDAIPLLQMVQTLTEKIASRAQQLANELSQRVTGWQFETEPCEAYAGGGSLPGSKLDSWAIVIRPVNETTNVAQLAQRLRLAEPAVMARIHQGALLLDLRSVLPSDDRLLAETIAKTCA